MSKEQLEGKLADFLISDKRRAAEIAYVLAALYLKDGDREKARSYGLESVSLFEQCSMKTFEECAAIYVTLAGIALPSFIHADVVKDRLAALEL